MSKSARVLYIEDDEMDRRTFMRMVRDKGLPWQMRYAQTLAAARRELTESQFDVIIADYHLPDGNSSDLFGEVREIPFVLVTATLEEQLALRTLERGADDYLIKDVERRYLEALPVAVEKTLYRKAIHEREQRLARQLRQSEQRLRATFDNAASGIVQTDHEDRLVAVNDRLCQMLGYTREELLGMNVHDLTYPEDRPRSDALNAELHEGRRAMVEYEKRYLKKDGSPLWVHVAVSAVRDDAGRHLYSVGTVVDISARKAAEAQVRLQAAALEAAPNAISLSKTDPEGTIVWVNPAFTTLTGYSAEEAIGHSHHLLSSGQQDGAFYRDLWGTIERGETWRGELVNRRKDGTLYREEMGITPLHDEQGRITHYVAIKQDISERKRAEERLRDSAEFQQSILNALAAHLAVLDGEGRILAVNEAWEQFAQDNGNPPRDRVAVGANYLEVCRGAAEAGEDDARRALAGIQAVLDGSQPHFTLEYPCHSPTRKRWYLMQVVPLAQRRGAVMSHSDITERKLAEEQLWWAKQVAEEASRAKDHFLAVLSHELRTPLTAVIPALDALTASVSGEAGEYLEMARRNVELEARLIDDLLDVTRIARGKIELEHKTVALCTIIHRAAEVCQPDIGARRLHFGIQVEDGPHLVHADPARLQQVFWNLIKNAVKFTPHGGCVGVRCWRESGRVLVQVTDTGEGIEPEALGRIFSAFEQEARSTTRQFGGLGLGLAISKALVALHGGTIRAHSAGKGQGATFTVELPIAQLPPAMARRQPQAPVQHEPQLAARRLKILLVEDHGDTARIMGRLLTAKGHKVRHAGDMATALDLAGREDFDVLVSDLGLPDGSGHDLMRRLVASGKRLPAIALSGYGMAADVQQSREAGFAEHVTKPVNFEALLAAVSRVANGVPA